ncbi:hypothetical protein BZG72_05450 [Salinivibrio sp. PR6]|uniref:hypothetical protein n=1 Tax=Salinivibrio sp. PR6 TaxID=1909485 RepID=UPI0009889BB2|nr:hypothetical protein [Salinivibrio sp. PR6]OOE83639.1 hypothetical protein BZG72_05450 [Salinivibrio sp. PR6]
MFINMVKKNRSIVNKLLFGIAFFLKWVWLLTLFLLGLLGYALTPFEVFEYGFYFAEIDLIETLFFVFFVVFFYHYIKRCRQVDAPIVTKVIMPWVHQAYVLLLVIAVFVLNKQYFHFNWEPYARLPLINLISYLLMAVTFLYSYYRINTLARTKYQTSEINREGVAE